MAAHVLMSSAKANAATNLASRCFKPGPWHLSSLSDAFCAVYLVLLPIVLTGSDGKNSDSLRCFVFLLYSIVRWLYEALAMLTVSWPHAMNIAVIMLAVLTLLLNCLLCTWPSLINIYTAWRRLALHPRTSLHTLLESLLYASTCTLCGCFTLPYKAFLSNAISPLITKSYTPSSFVVLVPMN
jgi:hypothetical protein